MSATLDRHSARQLVIDVLVAYGALRMSAEVVADHLVESDLAGLPSHGMIRLPQYVGEILTGEIDPTAVPSVKSTSPARVDVIGHRCFGQVACLAAVERVGALARDQGVALASLRELGHAGRIGAYAEMLGRAGLLSILFCSGPRSGHRVAPFNGREGRLATNPLAFSIPTGSDPLVGDFSTSAAPEGRIRHLRNLEKPAPEETLLDAQGRESTDPNVLYTDPPGTIMPLGGRRLGHRGYALGVLVESFATLLAGDKSTDPTRVGNNLAIIAISPDGDFASRAEDLAAYLVDTPARDEQPVILPGLSEQKRQREVGTLEVEGSVWQAIMKHAQDRNVPLPEPITDGQE